MVGVFASGFPMWHFPQWHLRPVISYLSEYEHRRSRYHVFIDRDIIISYVFFYVETGYNTGKMITQSFGPGLLVRHSRAVVVRLRPADTAGFALSVAGEV